MNSEHVFLSQLMQDNQLIYSIAPREWWFTDSKTKFAFNAIKTAAEEGSADVVTLGVKHPEMASYFSELSDAAHTTKNARFHAEKCREGGQKKALERLANEIKDNVQLSVESAVTAIDDTLETIFLDSEDYKITKLSDGLAKFVDLVEERYKLKGNIPGIPTGFINLDGFLMGLLPSRLYVIGARPSQGKSALMMNIATEVGKLHKVGIFSLESSSEEFLMREVAYLSGLNSQNILSGQLRAQDFSKIVDVGSMIESGQVYIYDKPNLHLPELVGQARRAVRRFGCEVLFIDYLQLIQVSNVESDRERVSKASVRLKDLSRELNIPIVALAQLRRDSEGRRPGLGDFQHTSQIEQDADVAMVIWHQVVDGKGKTQKKVKPEDESDELRIWLNVDKNRDGMTGPIRMEFEPHKLKFTEKFN